MTVKVHLPDKISTRFCLFSFLFLVSLHFGFQFSSFYFANIENAFNQTTTTLSSASAKSRPSVGPSAMMMLACTLQKNELPTDRNKETNSYSFSYSAVSGTSFDCKVAKHHNVALFRHYVYRLLLFCF